MDMHPSISRFSIIFGIFALIMLSVCTPTIFAQDDEDNTAPRIFIDRLQDDIEKSEDGDPILLSGEVEDDGLPQPPLGKDNEFVYTVGTCGCRPVE